MSRRWNTMSYVLILVAMAAVLKVSLASHFRGGTISWQPTGTPLEVEFKFKLGWTYGSGAGCTPSLVGQYVNKKTFSWSCSSGCTSRVVIGSYGYTCLAASQPENWELGEYNFRYTFNNTGPFTVEYTGGAWISLDYGSGGGNWRVGTVVDLRDRSDTGRPNYSPVSVGKPLYTLKYGCTIVLRIPVLDQEGDNVRCRWSVGNECASVCNSIPSTLLNEENCTLTISTTHTQGGMYAVAVTIEDRPKTDITLGGQRYTPNDVISSVPMQFLVYTPVMTQSCSDKPMFVDPTPPENSVIVLGPGETLYVSLYATSKGTSITSFRTFGLTGSRQSNIWVVAPIRPTVYGIDVTWTPTLAQKGPVTLCAEATDNYGLSSDLHCFTIVAWDINPCDSSPCMHNATCTRLGYTEDFTCSCIPGYTGVLCETEIINPCDSYPCMYNGTCTRLGYTEDFTCDCIPGYTGNLCETEIDECQSNPCQNNGTCYDFINEYVCDCVTGFTGEQCEIDINECKAQPCENGGTCVDHPGRAESLCRPGFTGVICQTGVDICASRPCQNDGICSYNETTRFTCQCVNGWQGRYCAYRHENQMFSNNSMKASTTSDYMHYSSCNCLMGNDKQKLCYGYSLQKDIGFGLLAAGLGVLSAILLYLLFEGILHKGLPCFRENKTVPSEESPHTCDDEAPVGATDNEEEKTPDEKKEKPRFKHCWACEVTAMSRLKPTASPFSTGLSHGHYRKH